MGIALEEMSAPADRQSTGKVRGVQDDLRGVHGRGGYSCCTLFTDWLLGWVRAVVAGVDTTQNRQHLYGVAGYDWRILWAMQSESR